MSELPEVQAYRAEPVYDGETIVRKAIADAAIAALEQRVKHLEDEAHLAGIALMQQKLETERAEWEREAAIDDAVNPAFVRPSSRLRYGADLRARYEAEHRA